MSVQTLKSQENTSIKFKKSDGLFFAELHQQVKKITTPELLKQSQRLLYIKLVFYASLYLFLYLSIFSAFTANHFSWLIVNYALFGLSGILLAFNASHDAVHDTLFKNKGLNYLIHYAIFNLNGVNAELWQRRHIHSHHIFPNVDGCDADIDDNPFIRLSASQPLKRKHRFQHLYAPLLYCLYTLHWIIIKDFLYLSKTRVANMTNLSYTKAFVMEVILLKLIYLTLTIIIPYAFTDYALIQIIIAFLIMHAFISIFFVLTLIISHLTMETAFPIADHKGRLPFDYYEHQLSVSLDYHPTSKLANWIFGGFNSHSAHHLFPNYRHTLYTYITPVIESTAKKYGLNYNVLPMGRAIVSHFKYLKALGRP